LLGKAIAFFIAKAIAFSSTIKNDDAANIGWESFDSKLDKKLTTNN